MFHIGEANIEKPKLMTSSKIFSILIELLFSGAKVDRNSPSSLETCPLAAVMALLMARYCYSLAHPHFRIG